MICVSSKIVPGGDDQNVYIVVDDFGRCGRCYRETDVEVADLETFIMDLLSISDQQQGSD